MLYRPERYSRNRILANPKTTGVHNPYVGSGSSKYSIRNCHNLTQTPMRPNETVDFSTVSTQNKKTPQGLFIFLLDSCWTLFQESFYFYEYRH